MLLHPQSFEWRLLRSLLWRLDPETAHDLVLLALALTGRCGGRAGRTGVQDGHPVAGLMFPNRLGLAAGFDKNGVACNGLARLGFGHIEVGTVTPLPQRGNPRPRIFRLPEDEALINRMGFPNRGANAIERRLARLTPRSFILGLSLGKQKETPLEEAARDYLRLMAGPGRFADYLAINISSPNTPGLRRLQESASLRRLLAELKNSAACLGPAGREIPLFLKLSPDLAPAELQQAAEIAGEEGVAGIIAANTTTLRPPLKSRPADESGGLSGAPLQPISLEMLRRLREICPGGPALVSCGGIMTPEEAERRLQAGADLIQIYTGLIYAGPGLPRAILGALARSRTRLD